MLGNLSYCTQPIGAWIRNSFPVVDPYILSADDERMRLHLVLALAVGAAAKDPAHDDQECGEAREEEDRDEEALREILQEMVGN